MSLTVLSTQPLERSMSMSMKMKDLPNGEYFVTLKEIQECAADRPEAGELHIYQKVDGLNNANAVSNSGRWLVDDDCIVVLCTL